MPELGLFVNVGSGTNFAERAFGYILSHGWDYFMQEVVQPLVDQHGFSKLMIHLASGRNEESPMDFDGFCEILGEVKRGNNMLAIAHPRFFRDAIRRFAGKNSNVQFMFYLGSLAKDTSMTRLPITRRLRRANHELRQYKLLADTVPLERMSFCFDNLTATLPPYGLTGPAIIKEGSYTLELIDELEGQGWRCFIESHPQDRDEYFFNHGSGFVALAEHWFSAWTKYKSRARIVEAGRAHVICLNESEIMRVEGMGLSTVSYIPWAPVRAGRFDSVLNHRALLAVEDPAPRHRPGNHRFVNGLCMCGQRPKDDPKLCTVFSSDE